MIKVNNRAVIRRLALRELKSNRRMSAVVIVSIILTCVLFTSLICIGGSMISGGQQETMRQVGGDRMAGLKCVLPEDYNKVRADATTQDVIYRILVGTAVNSAFKSLTAEVDCAGDESAARAAFSSPTTGRLPESDDEIAVSTLVLDALELPHELGIRVPLTLDVDGVLSEHVLTLCGFWQGDTAAMAQECWVSRSFADTWAPTPSESFYVQEFPTYAGYWQVDFNYSNSWDITGKTDALMGRLYGDADVVPETGINWAYTTSSVDSGTLAGGIVLLLIVFAAGYLIIYNIFYINISANIRGYGLLKTIGTTSGQIRRMVRVQAAAYSAAGIPPGLVLGVLLSRIMMRLILRTLVVYSADSYTIRPGLLVPVCAVSALITLATVLISCRKPGRIAGNVSPIEALRYNEANARTAGNKATSNKVSIGKKKSRRVTPFILARAHLSKARKRTVIVVLSLSISIVLLNTLITVLRGVDEDKFIRNLIIGDILIRHTEKTNLWEDRVRGITPEMIADFESIDGAQVHPVYYEDGHVLPAGKSMERLKDLAEKYRGTAILSDALEAALDHGYTAEIYAADPSVLNILEPEEGSIDPDVFRTGNYVIVYTYLMQADDDSDVQICRVGDSISIEYKNGEQRTYEVMAICSVPYALSTRVYTDFATQVVLPADTYLTATDDPRATCIMIDTDPTRTDDVSTQCKALCDAADSPLVYADKQSYLDTFQDFIRMIELVGGALSGILALIGMLNFVNAIVTGILSRRRELAIMNAVGMTGGQLRAMLAWEGIHYAILTAVCSLAFSALLSGTVIRTIGGELFFFTYRFILLPILVSVPVLLLLSVLVPVISYRTLCRESIVDRIRENG